MRYVSCHVLPCYVTGKHRAHVTSSAYRETAVRFPFNVALLRSVFLVFFCFFFFVFGSKERGGTSEGGRGGLQAAGPQGQGKGVEYTVLFVSGWVQFLR